MPESDKLSDYTYTYANSATNPVSTSGTITAYLGSLKTNAENHDRAIYNNQSKLKEIASAQNVMYTMTLNETERLNRKKNNVDQALDGQNRMITLNDSYVKKYAKYNQIVMVLVLVVLVILGATMLGTYVPSLPSVVSDLIMVLAVAIGAIVIYNIYMDIQKRDSLYFDKLKLTVPDISGNKDNTNNDLNKNQWDALNACFGESCCGDPPMHYINGKCRSPPTSVWNYTAATPGPVVCTGSQACSGTTDIEVANKTWTWDSENNRWINKALNKYWAGDGDDLKDIPPPPVTTPATSGFTNMNSINTIDNVETGYSYYK
jgi:hypothetical protein